jgi:xylulokinase
VSDRRTLLVGIDVGTSGVKGIAISTRGDVIATAEEGYPVSTPQLGWSEQDPADWWRAAQACLARLPEGPIGLSGQMHGLVTLDSEQRVLRPAILWNDQRTGAECAEIEDRIGLERLIELTGNRALTGFTAPKLVWLRNHEPDVYSRIRHILLPKDYVRLQLEGELAIDAADASGTLLFDVAHRRWSDEVLSALDIPHEWLPTAHESTEIAGAGDQAAGALGVGIDSPGPLSVVLGTSGVVFGVLPGYGADPQARLHTFCHAAPGTWHAMGVMLSAAGSLQWLRGVVGGEYAELVEEAARWPAGAEGATFLPYLTGERTPHADPDARASFTGLTVRHDRGALTRAVLEGVAYGLRDSLELMRSLGFEASVGRISGGGARSDLWATIVATVLGIPLERTAVDEGAAYGAALLAGVRSGAFADAHEAVESCVRVTGRVEPNPDWAQAYDDGYDRFRALYPALRPLS